ncbi:MAG: hypothetical protein HFE90_12410 [Firmicutes bacterium]|nr:hypothetical protein [Bacillota bacterium]
MWAKANVKRTFYAKRHVSAFPPRANRAGEDPRQGPLWPDRVGRQDQARRNASKPPEA